MSKGARMSPMQKVTTADNAMEEVRVARSAEMPPTMQMIAATAELENDRTKRTLRVKRDCGGGGGCGGGCGCGSGGSGSGEKRRRRRRRRHRKRANRLTHSILHIIVGNSTYEQAPTKDVHGQTRVLHDQPATGSPLIFVTNSSTNLDNGEEIESAEVIIITPDNGNSDNVSPSASASDEDYSSESMMMPYVGTYGSKVPPGEVCQTGDDCVFGAVCKHVSGVGHCVCEPPLINLGNGCVPRSGVGP